MLGRTLDVDLPRGVLIRCSEEVGLPSYMRVSHP